MNASVTESANAASAAWACARAHACLQAGLRRVHARGRARTARDFRGRRARTARLALAAVAVATAAPLEAALFEKPAAERFADSLVRIEVSHTDYDYQVPWVTRSAQTNKNGVVIEGRRILTTADGFPGLTLCRVQKDGAARQYEARLEWADFHANLALLTVDDPGFWDGLQPARLARSLPDYGTFEVLRWQNGRIEARSAEIERLFTGRGKMSYVRHLNLLVASEIDASGWAEVVIRGKAVAGLTTASQDQRLTVLPAPFIRQVLAAHENGDPHGLGYFDFETMPAKNPALLRSKGLAATDRGVVVTKVGDRGLAAGVLEAGDVILAVDGFAIDTGGDYVDPDYGRLAFEGLATRGHAAGDRIPMTIWRDGAELAVDYLLPAADFDADPVPEAVYDAAPAYLISGGLLFQPLTGPYLESFGSNRPILLRYYSEYAIESGRGGYVLLSAVLPDPANFGYEDARHLILDRINGQLIESLDDVDAALAAPVDGYHTLLFLPDQGLRHMVLDAAAVDAATPAILQRYNIPAARSGE